LFFGGLLTLWLVLDDVYMLHEQSPRIHLSERIVFAIYGALVLVYAVANLKHLLRSPFILLFAAGLLFASAIVVDSLTDARLNLPRPARGSEDMLELIGMCFWSAYFINCSRTALRQAQPAW
jgi:hypothetical protein